MTPTQIAPLIAALLTIIVAVAQAEDKPVDDTPFEADATVIGEVVLEKSDVFDLTDE